MSFELILSTPKAWGLSTSCNSEFDVDIARKSMRADGMVVVMDHQKHLTAAGMQAKSVSAFLPFNRSTFNNYAKKHMLVFPYRLFSCSIAITNDHTGTR